MLNLAVLLEDSVRRHPDRVALILPPGFRQLRFQKGDEAPGQRQEQVAIRYFTQVVDGQMPPGHCQRCLKIHSRRRKLALARLCSVSGHSKAVKLSRLWRPR